MFYAWKRPRNRGVQHFWNKQDVPMCCLQKGREGGREGGSEGARERGRGRERKRGTVTTSDTVSTKTLPPRTRFSSDTSTRLPHWCTWRISHQSIFGGALVTTIAARMVLVMFVTTGKCPSLGPQGDSARDPVQRLWIAKAVELEMSTGLRKW